MYPGDWTRWFLPLSSCTVASGEPMQQWDDKNPSYSDARILSIPRLGWFHLAPESIRLAVPDDIADEIHLFHRFPPVWWIGQFLHYILRPNTILEQSIHDQTNAMGFIHPIVGVHVRRTDKVLEAKAYPLHQYMSHVKRWYDDLDRMTSKHVTRNVFLATDEPAVLAEALSSFPEYKFLHIQENGARGTSDGVRSIFLDMYFLSNTDYTVCTHSSNVCRAAYELAQVGRGDFANGFTSLDAIYFLDDTEHDNRTVEIFLPHKALREGEQDLQSGDLINIVSDDWIGISHGVLFRNNATISFPSYKTMPHLRRVKLNVPFNKMGHKR